ncbi:MAG: DUF4430 domain-containing protein [Eubacteriales bacterium]|nr:DUF4430 domain-containing protein [Eubacteriales bacterium]
MKRFKKLVARVLLCAMVLTQVFTPTTAFAATDISIDKMIAGAGKALQESLAADSNIAYKSFEVATLKAAGALNDDVKTKYVDAMKAYFASEDVDSPSIASNYYATAIIGLTACGESVTNFDGKNLLTPFADYAWVSGSPSWYSSTTAATILVGLKKGGAGTAYNTTKDKLVEFIMQDGLDEATGAFGYGYGPDLDTTGMVLEALAAYNGTVWKATASNAVKNAADYLKNEALNADGLFEAWGSANAATTACVVTGLAANGLNPLNYLKSASGKTVFDGFKSVYSDGSFGATDYQAQSLKAVVALRPYVRNNSEGTGSSGSGSSGSSSSTKVTPTRAMNIVVENPVEGEWKMNADGTWNLLVNGQPAKNTWVPAKNPYAGPNAVAWFYFDANGVMLTGWQKIKGADGVERWYYLNTEHNNWYGACYINTVAPGGYTVDENGAWVESIARRTASASGSSGSSEVKLGKASVSVSTAAAGSPFSGSMSVEIVEGMTAFDALSALCDEKGWSLDGSGSYVSGINGLNEFDKGAQSGWMYKVNGKFPTVTADNYELKRNDSITWVYVTTWQNM